MGLESRIGNIMPANKVYQRQLAMTFKNKIINHYMVAFYITDFQFFLFSECFAHALCNKENIVEKYQERLVLFGGDVGMGSPRKHLK